MLYAAREFFAERLRGQVVTEDQLSVVQRVAGVDTHYAVNRLWAAIVVMAFPDLVIGLNLQIQVA